MSSGVAASACTPNSRRPTSWMQCAACALPLRPPSRRVCTTAHVCTPTADLSLFLSLSLSLSLSLFLAHRSRCGLSFKLAILCCRLKGLAFKVVWQFIEPTEDILGSKRKLRVVTVHLLVYYGACACAHVRTRACVSPEVILLLSPTLGRLFPPNVEMLTMNECTNPVLCRTTRA